MNQALFILQEGGEDGEVMGHLKSVIPKHLLINVTFLTVELILSKKLVIKQILKFAQVNRFLLFSNFGQRIVVIFQSALVLIGNTKQGLYVQIMEA